LRVEVGDQYVETFDLLGRFFERVHELKQSLVFTLDLLALRMHPIDQLSMRLSRLRGVPFPSVIKKISENKEQQNELR
jgi:hypothetical protein